jgi:hypothetical protein
MDYCKINPVYETFVYIFFVSQIFVLGFTTGTVRFIAMVLVTAPNLILAFIIVFF